jgi:hypothetical protein
MAAMVSSWSGSWKCGKACAFPTFPQAFLFIFKKKFPNKLTTKEGEDGATAPRPSVMPFIRLFCHKLLT